MKLGKYWANNVKEGEASASTNDGFYMWIIKNGKFVSDTPHKVPIQIAEEFMEREFGKVDLALVLRRDYQIIKKDANKDNSSPQSLTNSNVRSDNPISNSPKSIPELDRSSASSIKTIKFENKEDDDNNNYTDPVEKSSNKKLVINLRDIKQITLTPDGNLVIEFNKSENDNSEQVVQTVTDEQISINQELQIVKNYLQKNKQKSASQQELNNVLSTNSTSTEKPEDNNSILLVVGVGGALTIGLLIGLFVRRKRNIKKS